MDMRTVAAAETVAVADAAADVVAAVAGRGGVAAADGEVEASMEDMEHFPVPLVSRYLVVQHLGSTLVLERPDCSHAGIGNPNGPRIADTLA